MRAAGALCLHPQRRAQHRRRCPAQHPPATWGAGGISLDGVAPKPITTELLANADLVVTMSRHPTGPPLPQAAIRINGVDIAGQLVESACDSCSETCACNGGVDCRDWLWRGERSHEPPLGLIVEAIMRHAGGPDPASPLASPPSSATVPANLRQYFAATGTASGCCGNGVAGAACGCQAYAGAP